MGERITEVNSKHFVSQKFNIASMLSGPNESFLTFSLSSDATLEGSFGSMAAH